MARRFVRVDLSDAARDFRPIAVEPGIPLLDRSNANSQILFTWFGRLVAEPEWEGDSVNFFVRDDYGGRLEEVVCQPASDEDLKGALRDDVDGLRDRLAQAKPENPTERAVHKTVSQTLQDLLDDEYRTDRDDYFFKYRDALGRWRLVWCWGYRRGDVEPAPAVICTDLDCGLLFVRRPGQSPKCPSCEAALLARVKKRSSPKRALLAAVLLLLGCLLVYWLMSRNRLVATPERWTGRVGSRVEFRVKELGWFGAGDVSREAVAVVADPRVVRLDPAGAAGVARSPGQTVVQFYLGNKSASATLTVVAAENPRTIAIEPQSIDLGIGTTAHLKLIGEYEDGSTGELTGAALWEPKNDGVVFAHDGFVEGLGEGTSTIRARYRASPGDDYLEASANVSVSQIDFTSLEMAVDPEPVPLGRRSQLRIDAVSEAGKRYSVLESSLLDVTVDPASVATLHGTWVEGNDAGHGTMQATFNDQLSGSLEFDVRSGPGVDTLVVAPEQLELVVGEIADLSIASPSREPIEIRSSDREVVEVTATNRLIGRSEGNAQVLVSQAGETRTVDVVVAKAEVASIAVEPAHVVVPVDHTTGVHVMGQIAGDRNVELAPDLLACEKRPSPRYADFDDESMVVHGASPTEAGSPQSLAFRFNKLETEAPVEVVIAPLRLELIPSGNVDLPLGQMKAIDAWASYRGGYRVQVPPDRVDWHSDLADEAKPGLELRSNKVAALEGEAGPLAVWGTYLGRDSRRVTFRSVGAAPVELALDVDRTLRLANEPGQVFLLGSGPEGDVELVPELAQFESSDPEVLNIERVSGAFRAEKPGEALVTATHPASAKSATVELRVVEPVEVVILSDQGPAVQFPVGARFDDFRVEARYTDGFVRLVTKKATMSMEDGSLDGPVSFSGGQMIGVRPGKTVVQAEFEGVPAEKGLQVTVTKDADLDHIRLRPAPVSVLPGETVAMDAEGFKSGKSVGVITGLGSVSWKSDDEAVVAVTGPSVTGLRLGRASVTAQLGPVTSEPAEVTVVDSVSEGLVVDQELIRMRVGESQRIGTDLLIRRGDADFSRQCDVTPAIPGVVRYVPETRSLVGVSPGVSAVTFARGDQLATATVQVLPGGTLHGAVLVEPATAVLSPGQALELRVFLVTKEGLRIDRTDSAVLSSSSPGSVVVRGTRACAVSPGNAEISTRLPEADSPGRSLLAVDDEPITELIVEPSRLAMSVGDLARLRVLGRSASGTHELFPQPDLELTVGGSNPASIRIVGAEHVDAVAPGTAELAVQWQDRLTGRVPVIVTEDLWTDLRIEPALATIHPDQALLYRVTGLRGGRRQVLGPEDGLQLFIGQANTAEAAGGMFVIGRNPGRTEVVAQAGLERAEAVLNVTPGSGPSTAGVVVGGGPGYGFLGQDYIVDGGRRRVIRRGPGYVVSGNRFDVVDPAVSYVPPDGAVGLRFVPDTVRMGTNSPARPVQLVEVLADGTLGRDVTSHPDLEFSTPGNVATVEEAGSGPVIRPVAPGETRVAAKIGTPPGKTLFAEPPLLVQVGEVPTGLARLDVSPDSLDLWSGEAGRFAGVAVIPGPGQFPIDVSYSITTPGQGIVTVEPDGRLRGLSEGVAQVVITARAPQQPYDGLSALATVRVTAPEPLRIEPAEVALGVGETTPQFAVVAEGDGGRQYQVPAALDSMDPNILRPDDLSASRFVATSLGGTQVRAFYRGREAFAAVTVTGERFVEVKTTLNEGQADFSVAIEVLAANSEGPLEYRVYVAGQTPPETWVAAQESGEHRRAALQSPRMPYGPHSARYSLILEARSPVRGTVQQYPFTFRLAPNIERTDILN